MRVFAAIPLPQTAVRSITEIISPIRRSNPALSWVPESSYHLTLHFFGEIDEGAVSALSRLFEDSRLSRSAFRARLGSLGQFPPSGNPRVLWIALRDAEEALRSYWELFESLVSGLGWQSDKHGFNPHVTLARNRGVRMAPGWGQAIETPDSQFSLTEFVLFQSLLGSKGAQHIPLKRVSFEGETK